MQVVGPFGLEAWVQAADEDVVVVAVHRPGQDGGVGGFLVEVGRGPDGEEGCFGGLVGGWKEFAGVEEGFGGLGFGLGDRKGGLEALLGGLVGGDDVVVAVVEFLEEGPPLSRLLASCRN